jgi:hypothetical protein
MFIRRTIWGDSPTTVFTATGVSKMLKMGLTIAVLSQVLVLCLSGCTSHRPAERAAIIQNLNDKGQQTKLVIVGDREALRRRFPDAELTTTSRAEDEVKCERVLCLWMLENCEILIYWDDDGDGHADGFECASAPED